MPAIHLVIRGRVQGVGYRDWMVGAARKEGITGWVRNRTEGTVEALIFSTDDMALERLITACGRGPMMASVSGIDRLPAEVDHSFKGFERRPTA